MAQEGRTGRVHAGGNRPKSPTFGDVDDARPTPQRPRSRIQEGGYGPSERTLLLWKGRAEGYPLEATTVLVDGNDGLIREVRVLMRPWPVTTIFRNAMHEALAGTIPASHWELGPKSAASGASRKFTPIALKPIELAPDMVLHSPMLAKCVTGKAQVEEAVGLAHEVQSRSSYTSIIATPELLIEQTAMRMDIQWRACGFRS
jgi:hypothetical protein